MKCKKGVILITLLSITLIITILVVTLLQNSLSSMYNSQKQSKSIIAIDAAEAGIAATIYNIEDYYTSGSISPYTTTNTGTLDLSPHKVEYRVDVIDNITGTIAQTDTTGGYPAPPKSIKLISYGYIDKGRPGEYKRTIEVILKQRAFNLSLASSGKIDLGNLNSLNVYAVSGFSGNVHSNYNGDFNSNGQLDLGDSCSVRIDETVPYYGSTTTPYIYMTGKLTTQGILDETMKNQISLYQQNLSGQTLPACTETNFTSGTDYFPNPLPKGTYKVNNGKLQRYDYTSGTTLEADDVINGDIKSRLDTWGNIFGNAMAKEIYDNLATIITFPDATTMQITIPTTCAHVTSVNLNFDGDIKIRDSNFKCVDKIDVHVTKNGTEDGNLTVGNTNFSGAASIIVDGKITYEGYSNITSESSDKPAMYAGKGIDLTMKEGLDPNFGYTSGYIKYKGAIYSGGPINIINSTAWGLFVEGSLVANDALNPENGKITFHNNNTSDTSYLSFRYNPDYTRTCINLGDVSGTTTIKRFDVVYWHIRP